MENNVDLKNKRPTKRQKYQQADDANETQATANSAIMSKDISEVKEIQTRMQETQRRMEEMQRRTEETQTQTQTQLKETQMRIEETQTCLAKQIEELLQLKTTHSQGLAGNSHIEEGTEHVDSVYRQPSSPPAPRPRITRDRANSAGAREAAEAVLARLRARGVI